MGFPVRADTAAHASRSEVRHSEGQRHDLADADLVARVRAGDAAAFAEMFHAYYEPLCTFVAGYVESPAIAEDVVQDVFARVWTGRSEWQLRGGVRGYLYGAARNRALKALRRTRVVSRWIDAVRRTGLASGSGEGPPAADAHVRESELTAAAARAVERLPARRRQVYVLRRQHHLTPVETAQVMGVSVKCVELQYSQALRALREALADFF